MTEHVRICGDEDDDDVGGDRRWQQDDLNYGFISLCASYDELDVCICII